MELHPSTKPSLLGHSKKSTGHKPQAGFLPLTQDHYPSTMVPPPAAPARNHQGLCRLAPTTEKLRTAGRLGARNQVRYIFHIRGKILFSP